MELNKDNFLLKSYLNNSRKTNEPSSSSKDIKIKSDSGDNDEDEEDDDDKDNKKNKCECKNNIQFSNQNKKYHKIDKTDFINDEISLELPLLDLKLSNCEHKICESSDLSNDFGNLDNYGLKESSICQNKIFSCSSRIKTNEPKVGSEKAFKYLENESNTSDKSGQTFQKSSLNQCSSKNLPLNDFSSSTSAILYDPMYTKINKFEQQEKLKNKNKIKSISLDSPSITLIDYEQSNESLIESYEYDLNEANQSKSCDLGQEQILEENFNKNKNNLKSISLDSSRSFLTAANDQQINENKSELHPNYSVIIIDDNIDTYKNSSIKSRIDSEIFNQKISSISMPATPLKNFLLLEQQQKHQQSSKNLQLLKLNKSSSLSNNNLKTLPEILNDFYIQDLDENLANDKIEHFNKNQAPSTSKHYINTKNSNSKFDYKNCKTEMNFENNTNNLNIKDLENSLVNTEINDNLKSKLISKSNYNLYNLNNTLNLNRTDDFNCKPNLSKSSLNLNLNNSQKQNSQINLMESKTNPTNAFTLNSTILMPTQISLQANQNNGKKNLLQRRGSNTSLTLNLNKNKSTTGSCCYLNNRFSNSYNSLNLSAMHFQNQQQQQQFNQHQQQKFGSFQPNSQKLIKPLSSLSLYQKQGSMIAPSTISTMNMSKKKGLLERRNSNTSLTLNLQQQQNYQNSKQQIGLSISNYNLNSSSSSLNSINSNDFQQQQQSHKESRKLQTEHDVLSDCHQNSEYFDESKNKRKFAIRKDSMQSKTLDATDNDENNQYFETSATELNQCCNYQQRRKFLSSDGLNKIPQYSKLNQAHIRNLSKTCFGSVSDLKPTMIKSRNSDLSLNQLESSLNYTKTFQEDSQFRKSEINLNDVNKVIMDSTAINYVYFDSNNDPHTKFKFHTNLCSCTGMRNITTRPLSPQSTSEDFKIYLANIQLLQNATNQLNYETIKKLSNIFDNLFHPEENCITENLNANTKSIKKHEIEEIQNSEKKFEFKDIANYSKFMNENKTGTEFNFSEQLMNLTSQSNEIKNPVENIKTIDPLYLENYESNQQNTSNIKQIDYVKQKAEQKLLICQLHQEFWDLPTNYQEKPFVFNSQSKNRYRTILPNEHSRFQYKIDDFIISNKLFNLNQEEQPHQEPYINANYIKGPDNTTNYYIAAQGPMSNTLYEHWLMILQNLINFNQKSKISTTNKDYNKSGNDSNSIINFSLNQKIIMLTNFYESNRQKCSIYFPVNFNKIILINDANDLIDIIDTDLYNFYEKHLNFELYEKDYDNIKNYNSDNFDDDDDNKEIFFLNKILFSKCLIHENNFLYNKLLKFNNYFVIKNIYINDFNDFSVRKFQCLFIQTLPIKTIQTNKLNLTNSENTNLGLKLIIKKFQCTHYWYPNWPDHCSPNNIKSLLDMCIRILKNNDNELKPIDVKGKNVNEFSIFNKEQNSGPSTSEPIQVTNFQYDCSDSLLSDLRKYFESNSLKCSSPKETNSNLNNLFQINFNDQIEQSLPIIHCSAGIGRTGCLAAILNAIKQIHLTINYDYLIKNKKKKRNSIQLNFDKLNINDNNIEIDLDDRTNNLKIDEIHSINTNFNENFNLLEFKNYIFKKLCVDILAIVCNLRLQRGGMVQNSEQYELIHRAVCLYVKCLEENLVNFI